MNEQELQFVTYEQAKKLKALGFDWDTDAFCERQKRSGILLSQYLTPDSTIAA